jgi:hypothetical protein
MTEFVDSLTVAQCRFIRSTILSTKEQRDAFNTAVFEANSMDPKDARPETANTAIEPSRSQLPVTGAESKPVMETVVLVEAMYLVFGEVNVSRRLCTMPTNATFLDFANRMAAQSWVNPRAWRFNWAVSDQWWWVNKRWGDAVTDENWQQVRDAWLKSNGVLYLDLRSI